jgi:polyisoprenoid-binding protein YceI
VSHPSPRSGSSAPPGRFGRGVKVAVLLVLIAAVAGGGYGLWYLFLKPAGPAAVGLPAVPAAAPTAATSGSPATGSSTAPGGSAATTGIDGTWKVDTSIGSFSDFSSTFVGYRVQEQLATIGANTAVGRTPQVSGSLTIQGTTVMAVEVTADLTSLQSDDPRRDGQLRNQGLETSQFPSATFKLSAPVDLGKVPAEGETVHVEAKGDLTLHGQTKSVTIPLDGRLSNGVIAVTGSLPIKWADYSMQKPNSFAVLSIADEGTMELQVLFSRGS